MELDPNGKQPNEAGAKLDLGKNRLSLVLSGFARALQEVGKVGTYGAKKYADNGWMSVPDGEQRYADALYRHLLQEATGESYDKDTSLLHAAHAAWNALARLDLIVRRNEDDTKQTLGEYHLYCADNDKYDHTTQTFDKGDLVTRFSSFEAAMAYNFVYKYNYIVNAKTNSISKKIIKDYNVVDKPYSLYVSDVTHTPEQYVDDFVMLRDAERRWSITTYKFGTITRKHDGVIMKELDRVTE